MVRATDGSGKTSDRRPTFITRTAEELQWQLAYHKITFEEYQAKRKILEDKGLWWKK